MSAPIKDNLDWLDPDPVLAAQTRAYFDFQEMISRLEIELGNEAKFERVACGSWCEGCPVCKDRWQV